MKIINHKQFRPVDFHNHVSGKNGKLDRENAKSVNEAVAALGIDKACVSCPLNSDSPTPDEFHASNDVVFEAMTFSKRFLGFCFVNPGYARESLAEIERCVVRGGMIGVKLYHQYFICDPALQPVMEYAAELGIPVLMHAGKLTDSGAKFQPRLSNAGHFLKATEMFPQTILVQGHIGGGGDWEWNLRTLEALSRSSKYYLDTSGSVIDAGMIQKTVAILGTERVLFATDMSFEEGVGKVLDAGLSEKQLQKIFSDNYYKILSERRV
ncbi:MAG: amidohydrolase family protein [Verrucomicrobia bacterium]|nr:amidohydrolase family protein [Verrucomicrobiota bacterium]MCG2679220.1 amidohydrolase family protein [Kiritimatiellia bacterium]MBU4248614.1 amidohydrolase family protein [Verrucomicrobiota bacterium]MBU4290075.1 amidohydrolase family protein [Verrucomicrobiota bacterium]MBU4430351.1 amidohydrolase family protein [Verrucomicrobiota bacterium]